MKILSLLCLVMLVGVIIDQNQKPKPIKPSVVICHWVNPIDSANSTTQPPWFPLTELSKHAAPYSGNGWICECKYQ